MKQMRKFILPVLLLPSFAWAVPVYKYDLAANGIIKERCNQGNTNIASKLNFGILSKSASNYKVKIKIKACTNGFGLKAFNFIMDMPPAVFDENYLMTLKQNTTVAAGRVRITRHANSGSRAVFSLDPKSFGAQADGIRSIFFYAPLDKAQRAALTRRAGAFVWSAINITYQKGLTPMVTLSGPFMVATDESI